LAASNTREDWGATRIGIPAALAGAQDNYHLVWMRQLGKPLPLSEFCWNWPENAIRPFHRFQETAPRKKKREVLTEHLPDGAT